MDVLNIRQKNNFEQISVTTTYVTWREENVWNNSVLRRLRVERIQDGKVPKLALKWQPVGKKK
jgi:hypothetical protein